MANTVELVFGADQVRTTNQVISDLQKIAKNVEASGATKLKFALDTSTASTNTASLNKVSTATTNVNRDIKNAINAHLQYNRILDQSRNYYERYSSSIQKNAQLNAKWQEYLNKLQTNAEGNFGSQTAARSEMTDLTRMTREAGLQVETLRDKLNRLFGIHLTTALTMVGIHALIQSLQQVYQNVVQLDEAVVNLQVATGYSREQTQALISDYSKYAKELGATTAQVAEAADTWMRQGYSIDQANTLIKDSMMLSKLGMIDSGQATVDLTSAMKGYKISVEDVSGVVDKFTAIDMQAAVSAGYIAEALSETANSARIAGVDLDKVSGYIAAVGEVTQGSSEEIGNFYKTLFSRMGNIKQGLLSDPETGESLSNTEAALTGVGIKLRDSQSDFRNFGDVLDEVASKWSSFTDVQRRAVAVAFSGTRQQERFLTLMENYGKATEYASVAANSAGTALEKYNNSYLKSVEAAQDRATASFENFSNTILNSDLVAGTFNTGSGLLDFLTKVIDFGDGAIVKIGLLIAAVKVLDVLSVGKILPLIPEMVGVRTFVNCWETYERYCDYKVA